ncbi:MAG: hypothetical protein PWR27_457 [Petroclostridium sp.]|nr:hypothetical protein [Petroclostridium sp.]
MYCIKEFTLEHKEGMRLGDGSSVAYALIGDIPRHEVCPLDLR